jgi:hypothetical protein
MDRISTKESHGPDWASRIGWLSDKRQQVWEVREAGYSISDGPGRSHMAACSATEALASSTPWRWC